VVFSYNEGSQDLFSPLAFAEGLLFFLNYFPEKEGFLKIDVVYNKQR